MLLIGDIKILSVAFKKEIRVYVFLKLTLSLANLDFF